MRVLCIDPLSVEVAEWERAELDDVSLSAADERAIERFSEHGRKLRIDWLHGGRLRIVATSWIGVVRLDGIEIRIVPRLVGGDEGVLRMLSYAAGVRSLRALPSPSVLAVGAPHLLDLVGRLVAMEAQRLVELGLLSDYVTREETLATLRGRLRPLDQVRREFARVDRLACRFDEYETDILDNRVVCAGLEAGRRLCDDPDVRRRLASLGSLYREVCELEGHDVLEEASILEYDRRNEHYRPAHTWALLLLRQVAIRDLYEPEHGTRFAFLLDMNLLFEQFVSQLLEDGLADSGVVVHRQRRDQSIIFDEMKARSYAAVIPDVVLERRGLGRSREVLPLDVKYKPYDLRRLDSSDIYQTFLYAFAYRGRSSPHPVVIVYPGESDGTRSRLVVRDAERVPGVRLSVLTLDVPAALDAVAAHQPFLPLVEAVSGLIPSRSRSERGVGV